VDAVVLIFAALPVLGGLAMLVTGLLLRRRESGQRGAGTSVVATIVDNQSQSLANGRMVFRPVVEFRTAANKKVRAVGGGASSRSYVTGTTLPVVYDPEDPQRILAGTSASSKYVVGGTMLVVFGAGALALVVWALSQISASA
jgi:hypothetical protein